MEVSIHDLKSQSREQENKKKEGRKQPPIAVLLQDFLDS